MGLRTKQVERKLHYKAVGRNAHRFSLPNDKKLHRLRQREAIFSKNFSDVQKLGHLGIDNDEKVC